MSSPTPKTSDHPRWGADDERGALNLLTPDLVRRGVEAAKTGEVFSLGLPIRRSGVPHVAYRPHPQRLTLVNHSDEKMLIPYGGQPGTGSHEDLLILASHESTHMDALGHVYQDGATYNGWPHDDAPTFEGLARCSIDKAGPITARGVLLDVQRLLGDLTPGYVITAEDIARTLDAQAITLQAGDAVLVRTGWMTRFDGDMDEPQPGIGVDAARLLADADIVAVGSDNSAIEAMPFDGGTFMPVHIELLVRRGIFLVEHLMLDDLAASGHREFLFVCSPLNVIGASGSPVNPLAIC